MKRKVLSEKSIARLDKLWSDRLKKCEETNDVSGNQIWNCLCDLRAEVNKNNKKNNQ